MPKDVEMKTAKVELEYGKNDDKEMAFVRLPDGFEMVLSGGEFCAAGIYLRFPKKKFWEIFSKQMKQKGEMLAVWFEPSETEALLKAWSELSGEGEEEDEEDDD